jgi:hypothetical protein
MSNLNSLCIYNIYCHLVNQNVGKAYVKRPANKWELLCQRWWYGEWIAYKHYARKFSHINTFNPTCIVIYKWLPESLQHVFYAACILLFKWISGRLILKMWIYSWGNMCAQQASWKPFTWLGDEQVVFLASIANDFYYISSLAMNLYRNELAVFFTPNFVISVTFSK